MALPLPGSPSASWASFRSRLRHAFTGADTRVCIAFWLFGLINNVLYVVILSAALDLVGPNVPKGLVLLADVIPSFLTKLLAPYFIHLVRYEARVVVFVALSAGGMLVVALTPGFEDGADGVVAAKLGGVLLASLASGGGELSFVALVHYYGPWSLAAWGSGTGGAGIVGAGLYAVATTGWGLSVKATLLGSAFLPAVMLVAFFLVLPRGPLRAGVQSGKSTGQRREEGQEDGGEEREGLLDDPAAMRSTSRPKRLTSAHSPTNSSFTHNLVRARALFLPYMLPLLLVYIAEYTINQGVSPTLLFPLPQTPFNHYRAFYPTYNAIYQAGVFVSRSSTPFLRIHNLYLPSFLQILNLALLTLHSMYDFIPSVYLVFVVVFWEGLLGGLVYVNTFAEISEKVDREDREFSLGATTVSDSGGICVAGLLSVGVETWLCERQVRGGRKWCKML